MNWRPLFVGAMALSLAGCAGGALRAGSPGVTSPSTSDVLFAVDLVPATAPNVYEAVLQVRPDFFKRRGLETRARDPELRAYLDDVEIGDLETLRMVPLGPVTSVRYFDPREATYRWGGASRVGAILVTTSR
jgi:hypothetical protein